ncbi:hypothetical protein PIB30_060491 [Stylosanthes scabra]|uniref:Uncharacterized protein n=1 Tax=Stylosanthes scabra TaxID=79078 RepID=A0ABU6VLL1_9FABA|nr:hypothetical protein [Stylosanthes scabra]
MARFSPCLLRLRVINPYEIMINDISIFHGFIEPNIRNSCPELARADVSDVPGLVSCQNAPKVASPCRRVVKLLPEASEGEASVGFDG